MSETNPTPVQAASAVERELLWSLPANLRWLAERQIFGGYTPSGTLPGVLLKLAADRIEQLTVASFKDSPDAG